MKKILIGVITYNADWYCLKQFAESIHNLETSLNIKTEILIIDNSDDEKYMRHLKKFFPEPAMLIHYQPPKELEGFHRFRHCELHCRKMVREYFLTRNYDHLFFVDSDIICEKDVLHKLIETDKQIICGLFRYREPPQGRPLWFKIKQPEEISPETGVWILDFIPNEKLTEATMEIDACGFGAILISKEALQQVEFRKSPNDHYGADIHFCFDAKKLGYKIYGEPSAKCQHLYKQCTRRVQSNARAF